MRGDSSTQLATDSPNNPRLCAPAAAGGGRPGKRSPGRGGRLLATGFSVGRRLACLGVLGLFACGYDGWQQQGTANYEGKMALSWTINGAPPTTASCQSERIDSMVVDILSETDGQSAAEFLNVVCGLSRYSVDMVPKGRVTVYVNAIREQRDQTKCVRYAGIAHGTATSQFPQNALPIDLKAIATCP